MAILNRWSSVMYILKIYFLIILLNYDCFSSLKKQNGDSNLMPLVQSVRKTWGTASSLKIQDFPSGLMVKNLPANAGYARDRGSIIGLGRSLGIGNGNLFQQSLLENSMDRRPWWATVLRGVTESDMIEWLSTQIIWHLFLIS